MYAFAHPRGEFRTEDLVNKILLRRARVIRLPRLLLRTRKLSAGVNELLVVYERRGCTVSNGTVLYVCVYIYIRVHVVLCKILFATAKYLSTSFIRRRTTCTSYTTCSSELGVFLLSLSARQKIVGKPRARKLAENC